MLVVGLTGGIGSGKSEVSRRFEKLGIPVIDTDVIARELTAPGGAGLSAIAATFGDSFIGPDGALDRQRLRDTVFRNERQRIRLEDILHPRIRARVEELVAALDAPYVIVVVPLLLETRYPIAVDRVLVVDAPEAVQIRRVTSRDRISEDATRRIIDRQAEREQRLSAADDVIENTDSIGALDASVEALHRRYLDLVIRQP